MKTRSLATIVFATAFSAQAFAGSIGTLSWDETSPYIIDSADPTTQYVQLGLYSALNYSQTVSALTTDSVLSDFHIATQTDAYKFYNALGGSPFLDNVGHQNDLQKVSPFVDGVLGNNFNIYDDITWFLSDEFEQVGKITLTSNQNNKIMNDSWSSFTNSNAYSDGGTHSVTPISWLLVNDNVLPTPIPAAAFMFAPALLGLLGFRRKLRA